MRLICIPAIKNHVKYVDYSLKILLKYFPLDDFVILTPHTDSFDYLKKNNITIIKDDEYFDLSLKDVESKLSSDKKSIYKWYYQQFLKYSLVLKSQNYSDVLIIDADTIILSDCIEDVNSINLNRVEFHQPYFDFISNLFPDLILLKMSSIVNYMWFDVTLFQKMITEIEIEKEKKWSEILFEKINLSHDLRAFSEYETYSNYKYNKKTTSLKVLKIFRRADLFTDYYSFDKIVEVARLFKYDLISFEDEHDKSFLKKVYIYIIMIYIEFKLICSKFKYTRIK